ncbi:hypothetical protein GIW70_10170 [Pseudomonas syringae]|nr:hypothetical protein [Pseudomonas syringae]MCF5068565.1 hypothetical protein [Pseudomonas syringae]
MSQGNPNGTYIGCVYDAGESNAATLTITDSDLQNGIITNAKMIYYGLNFKVTGTFTLKTVFSLKLQAEATDGDSLLNINLKPSDNNCNKLDGKVSVARGGPNVGKTYDITFQQN